MNIKNILVATDFSNEAYNALYYATQIFASTACTFYIVHAYEDIVLSAKNALFTGQKEMEHLQNLSQENLTKTEHKIVLDTGNKIHKFNTISVKGSLPSVISKTIESHEIDLVVLGNKGKTGAKELFMGSNTIQIANTITTCPILAIPKEIAFKPIEEIAFVTDYKKGCTKSTISMLLNIANITDASIAVLHINEEEIMTPKQVSNQKLLDKCLMQTPHSYDEIWNYADKANVIQDFIAERDISMLAMSYHRRKFFERFLHEPVIMDLSIYATIPFLILPVQD
ncbi:Nucleotide-binding universal stress protein, UspA family [Maribacter aquivivus]|uniref:Nucleotide-binding universal stress protein, UspA family n=1 Tax=Maribacter aquivivus TaxID=228958 RepID=A0A1M6S2Q5_9FLAO|nr:universal stress protein [Maribacter aquivivus]SHK38950.1 Nucleotide-binding universal stress protein, UspA family [Maribacter aquivivus]